MKAFRLHWKNKYTEVEDSGGLIARVDLKIVLKSEDEAQDIVNYFNKHYKKAKHRLEEVIVTPEEIRHYRSKEYKFA